MDKRQMRILALLGAASLLLALLAASMPHLALQAGTPFSLGQEAATAGGGSGTQDGGSFILLAVRGALLLALAALPFYIILNLLTGQGRSRLVADLLAILVLLVVVNLLPRNPAEPPPQEAESALWAPLPFAAEPMPAEQFAPDLPPWLDAAAILALATLFAAAAAGLLWWLRKRRKPVPIPPRIQLAEKAQDALDALLAGENIHDAVIRSYLQMSQILQQERNIRRETAMTPHEFEQLLTEQGFPREPVQDLTRLFEKARYGNQLSGQREERQAIASLSAIVDYCRQAEAAT